MRTHLALVALVAGGCHPLGSYRLPTDDTASSVTERLVVTPGSLEFGAISVNEDGVAEGRFTIYNLGDAPLTVSGQDEVMGSGVFSTDVPAFLTLDPAASRIVHVLFEPPTEGEFVADILVQPGDELVHLVGSATAPVVEIGATDLPAVVLGCTGVGTVAVRNTGSEPLAFTGATVSTAEFAVLAVPPTLEPGASGVVDLSFTPEGGGLRGATLTLATNDPEHPEATTALSVLGYEGESVTETFRYAPSNPTDILFVVDNSPPLQPALAASSAAREAFVAEIRSTNVDYHLVSVASDDPCPANPRAYATQTDTSLQTRTVLDRGFSGASGAWDDDLLDLALTALDQGGAGGCLEGFRRPKADLHVIVVAGGPSTGNPTAQVGELAAELADGAGLRVSALLPSSAACGVEAPGYESVVRTTGGILADLCEPDWTSAFVEFAALPPTAEPVTYPLEEVPVPSTLTVTVEGAAFTLWSYDKESNAVIFDGDAVPALGSEVEITYVRALECTG